MTACVSKSSNEVRMRGCLTSARSAPAAAFPWLDSAISSATRTQVTTSQLPRGKTCSILLIGVTDSGSSPPRTHARAARDSTTGFLQDKSVDDGEDDEERARARCATTGEGEGAEGEEEEEERGGGAGARASRSRVIVWSCIDDGE
jgi:hypothetical protein